ncbi:hypothetical protein TcasGA2_TC034708 [Tribolium castaneum]|uniref:Uncharacterized protein n=1 Tax=Tribolium castaneum TaxID=7070 RepID=A0A139WHK7_TRICA|nr:hypothetical protein TcasGA2_TC034708 [Tribolium castaneum]
MVRNLCANNALERAKQISRTVDQWKESFQYPASVPESRSGNDSALKTAQM